MLNRLLYCLLFLSSDSFAQFASEADPARGMYIDKFVKMELNSTSVFDPDFSVLAVDTNYDGIFEKEDALLAYASANHITYIAMFDLHRILGRNILVWDENLYDHIRLEAHLNRFMKKAKSLYGIKQIGAIGGSETFFDSLASYLTRYPDSDFDVVNIEYEFWMDCPVEFPNYVSILDAMYDFKENYNASHPGNEIISEAYLADLYACNGSFGQLQVVRTIDGCTSCSPCATCTNPQPRKADRILHAWYISDPATINIAEQNLFENSLTEDSTDFHPILYAESYNTGGTVDWTGIWFPLSPNNNIFTAEESYYTHWRNDPNAAFGSPRQNNVQPGGVHWFTATNMVGHLSNPQILRNTGPYCSSAPTERVHFNYYGPVEKDIAWEFWVTRDSDNAVVYPPWGGHLSGLSAEYVPQTSVTAMKKSIDFSDTLIFPRCELPTGEYTAHLVLKYDSARGESYSCDNKVVIAPGPRTGVNGRMEFCEGNYTYLNVRANGGQAEWFRNGISTGSTAENNRVEQHGHYYAVITGGNCPGVSDSVFVNVKVNPPVAVNAVCNGNGTATLHASLLNGSASSAPGGLLYEWNNSATTPQITVTPPSGNTTYRVLVTNPYSGCTRTAQITLKSPLTAPYASSITVNQQPTSSCSSDGMITATLFANNAPNNYLWSTGATTRTLSGLPPGTYSVAMNVWAAGCTAYDTVTIGTPAAGPLVNATVTDARCDNTGDGSISLSVSGGNPPYSVRWIHLPNDTVYNTGSFVQGSLFPGTYALELKDAGGCIFTGSYTVASLHASPQIQSVSTTPASGCSASDGTAEIIMAGGAGPYAYSWEDTLLPNSSTLNSLPAGSFEVTVTDANGCTAHGFAEVAAGYERVGFEILSSEPAVTSCAGASDGEVIFMLAGGSPPYSVNSPWTVSADTATLYNAPAGSYHLEVVDANGCTYSRHYTVSSPDSLVIHASFQPAACIGCTDGIISVASSGGTPPYTLTHSPATGNVLYQQVSGLPAGIYTVCIEDAQGCAACLTDTISELPQFIADVAGNVFTVTPNPFDSELRITNSAKLPARFLLTDVAGKTVHSGELTSDRILQTDLPAGIYLLHVFSAERYMSKKLVKLHTEK